MEYMLKKRSQIALVLLFFLLSALVAALILVRQRQEIREKAQEGGISVYILPTTTTVPVNPPNNQFTLNVDVNAVDDLGVQFEVTGVELHVGFDPNIVQAQSLQLPANPFLPTLVPSTINIDNINGVVSGTFISDIGQGSTGIGTLGQIVFQAVNPGTSTVSVLQTTEASALSSNSNVVVEWGSATVNVTTIATSPSPTPAVTPSPSVFPSVSPSVLPSVTPSIFPSATPAVTPSPQPTPTPGGPTPTPQASASPAVTPTPPTGGADPCVYYQPEVPTNVTATAISATQVTLTWTPKANITHYGIVYGNQSHYYAYGAADVGNVTGFTVGNLSPSTTYYFAVFSVNDCGSSNFSNEVAATTRTASAGVPLVIQPSPGDVASNVQFVPINPADTSDNIIPFLEAKARPTPTPSIPTLSLPPEPELAAPSIFDGLFTRLGGIFLIIVGLFVGIFFLRMRRDE